MALAAKTTEITAEDVAAQASPAGPMARSLDVAAADAAHTPSPALALQSRLEGAYAPAADVDERWSARRSIAFAVGASVLLWALIGLSVRALLQ